jgi:hypothetical protein
MPSPQWYGSATGADKSNSKFITIKIKKMTTQSQQAPDNNTSATGLPTTTPATGSRSRRRIPEKDNDFDQLCRQVNTKWTTAPDFVLRYTTQAEFALKVNGYSRNLNSKQRVSGDRPSLTQELALADAEIKKGINAIKLYLREKYEEQADAYYTAFGIERRANGYVFPKDRNKRLNCLLLAKTAIVTEGFSDKKYGAAFWNELYERYKTLTTEAIVADGDISQKVGSKNVLRAELEEVLNSLILLIKANFPQTAAAELRNWGFQKDKY